MATNQFDLLVQLDEKLLNKALAMVYYTGFLKLEGDYNFVDGVPEELLGFTRIKYNLHLKSEPFVDLRAQNEVFIRLSCELNLIVLTGVPVSLDVELNVKTHAEFDLAAKNLLYKIQEAQVLRMTLNDKIQMHRQFITKLNHIFGVLLNHYFRDELKAFEIPLAIHQLELPMMPDRDDAKLPVSRIAVMILNNKTLAVGINFFRDTAPASLSDQFTAGQELFFGIKKTTLSEIFHFWWEKTTFAKQKEFEGQTNIGFDSTLEKGVDLATRILSLGFIESDTNYENVVLDYGGTVKIAERPEFQFTGDNKVNINKLIIETDLYAKITADILKDIYLDTSSFVPDKATFWEDDKKLKNINKRKEILSVKDHFDLEIVDAWGRINLNDENQLVIEIEKADFNISFKHKGAAFTQRMWENLMNFIKEKVIEKIPPLVISPSLVLSKVNIYGFTVAIDNSSILINADDVTIRTNIIVNELKSLPVAVPLYIANKKSKVLHRFECSQVSDIDPNNRVGYFVVYEALTEHYKTCKSCLGAYHIH